MTHEVLPVNRTIGTDGPQRGTSVLNVRGPGTRAWTLADRTESDCLLAEIVAGYFAPAHFDRCPRDPCPHLAAAVEAYLGWRHRRELLTLLDTLRASAALLRAREDLQLDP